MDIVEAVVQHLNPGQVPMIAVDQPLYALAKQIQWSWTTTTHGEDVFVMLGGLHIEKAILKVSYVKFNVQRSNSMITSSFPQKNL